MLDLEVCLLPRHVARHGDFLQPRLAALPADALEVIGGGSERVGRALDQIAAAVAVEVDAVFDVIGRRELHAAELAGPVAVHFVEPLIAALDDAQRIHQFGTEMIAAPAVISKRRQRRQNLELAEQRAVIAFQAPDGGDDLRRHAIGLLDATKQRLMFFHLGDAVRDAGAGEQALGEIEESSLEDALAGIAFDHRLVKG